MIHYCIVEGSKALLVQSINVDLTLSATLQKVVHPVLTTIISSLYVYIVNDTINYNTVNDICMYISMYK